MDILAHAQELIYHLLDGMPSPYQRQSLQALLEVQRLVHNWVRPRWGLGKNRTPATAMGYCSRSISMHEILTSRGFHSFTL